MYKSKIFKNHNFVMRYVKSNKKRERKERKKREKIKEKKDKKETGRK